MPPHAVIPDLESDGNALNDWKQLEKLTKKQREFVLKPSGFSELAYGSRGVAIGPDIGWQEEGEYSIKERQVTSAQIIYSLLEQDPAKRFIELVAQIYGDTPRHYAFGLGNLGRMLRSGY